MPDFIFKLIIVGDSFTGKTSLLNKSCYNTFTEHYDATIGVDFITKVTSMSDGIIIKTHRYLVSISNINFKIIC